MRYIFRDPTAWFGDALCCRYLVVQFGRLRVRVRQGGVTATSHWLWALGLFKDGSSHVLGAWRDDGPASPQKIAADLHDRGLERIRALAADDQALRGALARFRPRRRRATLAGLAASGAFGPRMRRAFAWAEAAGAAMQGRLAGVVKRHGPFASDAAAADFIAQAFQRADRDLLADWWDRSRPARFGELAAAAAVAVAALSQGA
jgi:hypothetical protein